jgi:NNP family nitrate/nitrite transporter-like MFS transporter
VQLVGVLVLVVLGAGHPRVVASIYMPAIVLAAVGSPLFIDNLSQPRNQKR